MDFICAFHDTLPDNMRLYKENNKLLDWKQKQVTLHISTWIPHTYDFMF
jgi:hypothetical protein